ncbi:trypsin-like serine protease [Micromonospora ureilytica]|uniref:trypsin-like serine protease n=1 Tax=Micromonospora ureilytica TaxID=709868 RepID=UPI000F5FF5BE|nr:trypsin-like serine protease [Micromonospora ureilytica]
MRTRGRVIVAGLAIVGLIGAAVAVTTGDGAESPSTTAAAAAAEERLGSATTGGASATPGATASGGVAPAPQTERKTEPKAASGPVRVRPAQVIAQAAPASVAYLRDRYRISATEAARRLALQELSAPLAARLTEQAPRSYGGMWLDQQAGGVLTVGATDVAAVQAAVAELTDPAHVRVVAVRHTLSQLTEAAAAIAGTLDASPGSDVVVDQQANEIVVLTGDQIAADDPRLAEARRAAGVSTRAQARTPETRVQKACDPRYCPQAPMRGGIRLDVPRDDGTVGGCTTGFNLIVGARDAYVLTAGHCVVGGRHQQVDRTWHQFLGPKVPVTVEKPTLAENAYPYDYAIMPYQAGALPRWTYPRGATSTPSLVNYWCVADNPRCSTSGSRDVRITGYVPWSAIQTGWVVCATGSAYTPKAGEQYVDSGAGAGYVPGTRCGEITGKSSGGIDVRICARPGDSGGPLFGEADGKALGILSSGDPGQGACTNPNEHNSYAPVSTILERVNARSDGRLRIRLATSGPVAGPVAR